MDTDVSKKTNWNAEERTLALEERVRHLERRLARYEPESIAGNSVVSVYRNGEPFGQVVLAEGGWIATPGVPDMIQSDIILAYYRDNILFGSASIDGDNFSWRENMAKEC